MSQIPLSSTQEVIERSLFESIRLELVDKGYLPDITNIVRYPDNDLGWSRWEEDILSISNSRGFAIELFGSSNNQAKGIGKVPRIIIESGNFLPGDLGGDPRGFFENTGSSFNKLKTPPQTTDFFVNIHLVSNTIAQSRVLNSLLSLSIPRRSYIKLYNDPTNSFFIQYLNFYDLDDLDKGIIQHVYAYKIPDTWDMEDTILIEGVSKISEITLNTNLQKYMDGTWGSDSIPLVIKEYPRGVSNNQSTVTGTLVTS